MLELPAFNRGMARYRMLHKGSYRVQFTYVPEWDNERMRADGIGMVRSNELVLNVSSSAPPTILGCGTAGFSDRDAGFCAKRD